MTQKRDARNRKGKVKATTRKAGSKKASKKAAKKKPAKKASKTAAAAKQTTKKAARKVGAKPAGQTDKATSVAAKPVSRPAVAIEPTTDPFAATDEITIEDLLIEELGDIGSSASIEPEPEPEVTAAQFEKVEWSKAAVLEDESPFDSELHDAAEFTQFAADTGDMARQLAGDLASVVESGTTQLSATAAEQTDSRNAALRKLAGPFFVGLAVGLLIAWVF